MELNFKNKGGAYEAQVKVKVISIFMLKDLKLVY